MEPQYSKTNVLLTAKNINLSFGDKVILSDINFQIKDIIVPGRTQGQVVALVGISGKGKTQLLRILSGLGVHGGTVTGQVLINETQTPVQGGEMGIVFQDYYMPEHLKIHEMFKKSAKKNKTFKIQKTNIEDEIQKIAAVFEITEHLEKYPRQLSGGQKQRANIAMQLLNGSNFILMDEPFSGLDPLMIDKTINLLRKVSLSDELKTFIIVSHDLENCIAIADTVFVLSDKGRKPGTGSTIIKEIDLIERDLAWHEDVKRMPAFHDTINEIKFLFA